MNSTKQPKKFTRFLRNNAALLLLVFCVLAIVAVVLAVTLTRDTGVIPDGPVVNNPNEDDQPGNVTPGGDDKPNAPSKKKVQVFFASPIDYTSSGLDYTGAADHLFVFKSTLNEWSVHKALDLIATDGTEVTAMYDGTVIDAGYTYLKGYYVTIDHGENVVATYASIADLQVQKGAQVKQGDVLGYASTSAENEYHEGAHVHLEVTVNGKKVDPTPYVIGEVYREIEIDA